ncbi:sigma-70 family RNA polymerase sigma factor [Phenylobacterium sp. LjRoot225]|uniref:sigma-70 family RNA polymerase sigma factor n=1 Tax=Phenylobacterium sp. LjRoot225 TaxID=3342285 RepID=UPI003ED04323
MLALTPKLRAYAWVLTRGTCDADDLVQETLMRAWQFRHTFRPGSNLKAWMFRIQRNAYLAGLAGKPKIVADINDLFARRLAQEADQEWRVRFGEMLGALAQLPEQNREALLLVASTGFTYDEAAHVCDCSIGTIKSRVSRARERLAELMDTDLTYQRARVMAGAKATSRTGLAAS